MVSRQKRSLLTSPRRWVRLKNMVASLERCMEVTARLDAHRARPGPVAHHTKMISLDVERRLTSMQLRLDREVNRLTSQLLLAQLEARKRYDQRTPAMIAKHDQMRRQYTRQMNKKDEAKAAA